MTYVRRYAKGIFFPLGVLMLIMLLFTSGAWAHVPVEADVTLRPIFVYDGGEMTAIHYEDARDYCRSVTGRREFFDVPFAFRAAQLGIREVWGSEAPRREDLAITGGLPTYAATLVMQYITGAGENMDGVVSSGEYRLLLRDGREVTDMTFEGMRTLARELTPAHYTFNVANRATGESFTATLREGVIPERYFELVEMANYGTPRNATPEEVDEFTALAEEIKEEFLNHPDHEIFALKGPFPLKTVAAAGFALLFAVGLVDFWRNDYKKWKKA